MDNKEIMVSISCMTYNHGPYIRQCLEGFINQKTNFAFEVLVHDDASTDNTAEIILEYAEKYPEIIKPICQTENQLSKKLSTPISMKFNYSRAKGKYIATCEGDDYWIDDTKLQKQFDFMEAHPDCSMCTHSVQGVDAVTGKLLNYFPKCKLNSIVTPEEYIEARSKNGYILQFSCYFMKSELLTAMYDLRPEFLKVAKVGDEPIMLWFALNGNIGFLKPVMSHYRRNVPNSWTIRHGNNNPERTVKRYVNMTRMFIEFNEYSDKKYQQTLQVLIQNHRKAAYLYKEMYNVEDIDLSDLGGITEKEKKSNKKLIKKYRFSASIRTKFPGIVGVARAVKHKFTKMFRRK